MKNKKEKRMYMKLEYELIDNNNINLATSVQHTIFPEECAYMHYKYSIDTNYKESIFYIIKYNNIPAGVIGLYTDEEMDPASIWVGWFGVLLEFRHKGIGRKALLDIIEKAKEYNKKYLRLYTNNAGDPNARFLYRSAMQTFEKYNNKDDYNYNGNCLVYSYSLSGENIEPWDNRFMDLIGDVKDEQVGNRKWKDKYRILILSNPKNEEFIEDELIATAFRKDGHLVTVKWIDYEENLDNKFDIIIRRNTWVESEEETKEYKIINDRLKERLKNKSIKTVNLEGLDGKGKSYLCKLYKEGKKVIPTIDTLIDFEKINKTEKYVLKDSNSFGSGLGQKFVKLENIKEEFKEGYLIQPKLKFKSEVQCYFVGQNLMYVYEYTPSKYPDYPIPKLISLNEKEMLLAYEFAKISNLKIGFQRIDFLRLENNELILLEIEDNSPYMNLQILDDKFREYIINEYKKNIYGYLK